MHSEWSYEEEVGGVTRKKWVGHLKTKYAVVKPYCTSLCSLVPRPLSSFSALFRSTLKVAKSWAGPGNRLDLC